MPQKKRITPQSLGFKTYADYLKSDHWKSFRKCYRASSHPQKCLGCDNRSFQLHHVTYKRLGSELLTDVIPLCKECHKKVHDFHRETGVPLGHYREALASFGASSAVIRALKTSSGERPRKKRKKKPITKAQVKERRERRAKEATEQAARVAASKQRNTEEFLRTMAAMRARRENRIPPAQAVYVVDPRATPLKGRVRRGAP